MAVQPYTDVVFEESSLDIGSMWHVRPAREADATALAGMAMAAPRSVLHTLPRTVGEIASAIERSVDSFASTASLPADEYYLLVLADPAGQVRGSAAVRAAAGSQGTFFCYRNDVVHHASPTLNISHGVHVLNMCSDLTEHSHLMSFFTSPLGSFAEAGVMLSRARLLLAGAWPERFAERFLVSMGGWTDSRGQSPFWEALGRKFFGRDLIEVERALLGSRHRIQVAAVMPHFPIYVPLLPESARSVIGQMHSDVAWPFDILTEEGFESDRYLDMFDGGPILEAHRSKLKTWAGARDFNVRIADRPTSDAAQAMVSGFAEDGSFGCCLARVTLQSEIGIVTLPADAARRLQVHTGDIVRVAAT